MIFFVHLFILFGCVLQSFYSFNITDEIIYPPDSISTRVVGGIDAPDGVAPFQCSLQLDKNHFCGCSIISDEWILTASHCLIGKTPEAVDILVGTNDLKNGGKYYKTERFVLHETFNDPMYAYDIALIQVQEKIEFNDLVQPIVSSSEGIPEGADVQLTGWGKLKGYDNRPQRLQIINLKALPTEKCRNVMGKIIHDSHICTFTKHGEGACQGDSGGPLVYMNKLVGVVNFGRPCAVGMPDAFGKVSYLYDWIQQNSQ